MPHLQNGGKSAHRMKRNASKRNFSKKAMNTNGKNFVSGVMRGGIRF